MNFLRVRSFALHGVLYEGENVDLLAKAAKVYCFRNVSSACLRNILIAQEEVAKPEPRFRDSYDLNSMVRFLLENPTESLAHRLAQFQEIDWVILQHVTEVVDAGIRENIIQAATLVENNSYAQLFLLSQPESLSSDHISIMVRSEDPIVLLALLSKAPNLTLEPKQHSIVINNLALLGIFDSLAALDDSARITLLNNLVQQTNVTASISTYLTDDVFEKNAFLNLLSNTDQLREDFSLTEDSALLEKTKKTLKKHQEHRCESLLCQILGFGSRVPVEYHSDNITRFLSTIVTYLMSEIKTREQIEQDINSIQGNTKKSEYAKEMAEKVGAIASWIVRVPKVLDELVLNQSQNAAKVAQALDGSWQSLSIDFYLALFGSLWGSSKEKLVSEDTFRWVVEREFFLQLHFLTNDIGKSWSVLKVILSAEDSFLTEQLFARNKTFTLQKRNSDSLHSVFPLFQIVTLYTPVNDEEIGLLTSCTKKMLQEINFDIEYYLSEEERSMSFQISSVNEQQQHKVKSYRSSEFFRGLPIVQQARRLRALITGENLSDVDTHRQGIIDQEVLAFDLQYRYSEQLLNFIYSLYKGAVSESVLSTVRFDEETPLANKVQTYYQKILSSLEAVQALQLQQWAPTKENPQYFCYTINDGARKRIKRITECIQTLPVQQICDSPSISMFLFVSHIEKLKHELNKDKKIGADSKRYMRVMFLEYVAFSILDYTALARILENEEKSVPAFLNIVFMLSMAAQAQRDGVKELITKATLVKNIFGLPQFLNSGTSNVQVWLRETIFPLDGKHKNQVNDICFALTLLPEDLLEAVFGSYSIRTTSGMLFKKTEEMLFFAWIRSQVIEGLKQDTSIEQHNLENDPRQAIFSVSLRRRDSTMGGDENSSRDSIYSDSSSAMYSHVNPMENNSERYENNGPR